MRACTHAHCASTPRESALVARTCRDDEELLFTQVKMTAAATPGTTVWVYRNTVYGYPWYTDVRKTLEDPAYAPWYFKFAGAGPWYVRPSSRNDTLRHR